MFFLDTYTVLGAEARCKVVQRASDFSKEVYMYTDIRKTAHASGWEYIRVETHSQQGFPDIVLIRGPETWLIECKVLKSAELRVVETGLQWQFGQLAFLRRAFSGGWNYLLAVGKSTQIAYIRGGTYEQSTCYPDIVRCV